MGNIVFYIGGNAGDTAQIAIDRFAEMDKVEYLSASDIRPEAFKSIMFMECCGLGEWHIRRYYDPLINEIDTESCRYYIFDSVSDYVRRFIDLDGCYMNLESYTDMINENLEWLIDKVKESDSTLILISDEAGTQPFDKKQNLIQSVIFEVNRNILSRAEEILSFEDGQVEEIK